jgi:DNA-binding transcriptional regulator GbsR (MarR family)
VSSVAESSTSRFIEEIAVLLEADGLPRVAGRMFGILLVSEEPRSLEELASCLGASKASISVNARLLEQRGVLERVGKQGDRRDYYRIADDILERSLEQRLAKIRRFQEALSVARTRCPMKPLVRARFENMDHAYCHLLDATSRALRELREADPVKRTTSTRSRTK